MNQVLMNQSIKIKNINKFLLKTIMCPVSKKPLIYDKKNNELISNSANLAYPIIDDIPILLKSKARKLKQ